MPEAVVTIAEEKFVVDLDDVTGIEARAFRKATGADILTGTRDLSLHEYAAGIKWLVRWRENPAYTFEEALGSVSTKNFRFSGDAEQEAEGDPPV